MATATKEKATKQCPECERVQAEWKIKNEGVPLHRISNLPDQTDCDVCEGTGRVALTYVPHARRVAVISDAAAKELTDKKIDWLRVAREGEENLICGERLYATHIIAVCAGYWGKGTDIHEAVEQLKKAGGRGDDLKYICLYTTNDPGAYVDGMGCTVYGPGCFCVKIGNVKASGVIKSRV